MKDPEAVCILLHTPALPHPKKSRPPVSIDNDITEHFAERAAIAEHDGGLSRRVAEYQAARATREAHGRLTDEIERQMRETRGL